jgi:hypothetical protein
MWYNKNGSEKEDMGVYFICDGATSVIVFVADKMRGPVSLFFTSPLEAQRRVGSGFDKDLDGNKSHGCLSKNGCQSEKIKLFVYLSICHMCKHQTREVHTNRID